MFKTLLLTSVALIAFAANSVLNRLALVDKSIDAPSFTIIRLLSGAVVLLLILLIRKKSKSNSVSSTGSWTSSLMLFIYAISFSLAYVNLDTATGALILFAAVQISMLAISMFKGIRLSLFECLGVIIAFIGFVYLVLPDISTPSATGFLLMTVAGIAWGIYTLNGHASKDALSDTAYNFIRTIPFVIIVILLSLKNSEFTNKGILLAMLSGGVASGIGYTIWYSALRGLTSTQAAVVQLSVPVIAALGGVVFVSEYLTIRLFISIMLILGGIFLVIIGKRNVS